MRKSLSYLFAVFVFCATLRAELPSIEFNGVRYVLASVDVTKGTITNEYVPIGQSINAWTTLIGVRYWPEITTASDAANFWVRRIRSSLVRDATAYASTRKNDEIVEAWLAPQDRAFVEINLHRFVVEDGVVGVKAYQYAQRIGTSGGKGDVSPYVRSRNALFTSLQNLKLRMHNEMK